MPFVVLLYDVVRSLGIYVPAFKAVDVVKKEHHRSVIPLSLKFADMVFVSIHDVAGG